jgi:hypothetical protein
MYQAQIHTHPDVSSTNTNWMCPPNVKRNGSGGKAMNVAVHYLKHFFIVLICFLSRPIYIVYAFKT